MIARRGRIAFANARVRALKSRLFGREFATRASSSRTQQRAGDASSIATLAEQRFSELIEWYACVLDSYPRGQPLFRALVKRHEIENVKLAWRVAVWHQPLARWAATWLPMGTLETLSRDVVRDALSLPTLVAALANTPYAEIASGMLRAHPADPLAAEQGFDSWTSRAVVDAAAALPQSDALAREIAFALVRDRDLEVVRRAGAAGGAGAVIAALAVWPRELNAADLQRLVSWKADEGPLWPHVPRSFRRRGTRPADWDALKLAWRIERRELCRRAFLDQPFSLAPAVALLVLKEEEIRGLTAIAESDVAVDAATARERVLSGGLMGA